MAKNDNLSDFLTDIANAIREKKGTSGTIPAQDFSDEILSIQGGGSGGGGVGGLEHVATFNGEYMGPDGEGGFTYIEEEITILDYNNFYLLSFKVDLDDFDTFLPTVVFKYEQNMVSYFLSNLEIFDLIIKLKGFVADGGIGFSLKSFDTEFTEEVATTIKVRMDIFKVGEANE